MTEEERELEEMLADPVPAEIPVPEEIPTPASDTTEADIPLPETEMQEAAIMEDMPFAAPPPSDDPPASKHLGLRILAVLTAIVFIAFAGFCVYWDVRKGTTSGGYQAGNPVKVEIIQQDRPKPDEALTDADGRYTVPGIAQTVMPSIVEIYVYADGAVLSTGSGIILTADGYIATNAHVVEGGSSYLIHLFDETRKTTEYRGELVGHDTKTDLAVLKIATSGLKPAVMGNSDQVVLGEDVCALGNPAGLSGSISTGIISGMNRRVRAQSTNFVMECFQTDAAISPGNSGGALVNRYGQVIGITSSKYKSRLLLDNGSYEGLGFAITINQALPILKELTEQGYVSGRVRIGIQFYENGIAQAKAEEAGVTLPKELDGVGVQILEIDPDSDLNKTVFKKGDWILTMNGKDVYDYDSLCQAIEGKNAGDSVHCRCGHIDSTGKLQTYEIDFCLLEDQSGEY